MNRLFVPLGLLLLVASQMIGCLGAPGFKGSSATAPFDGKQFSNQVPTPDKRMADILRWRASREPGQWHDRTHLPPGPPPPQRVSTPGTLRTTPVGHATVLVQMDGINILTDPVYSDRIGPLNMLGPKRYRAPGIRWPDLPRIDVVVISHNHYDHFDVATLERLAARDRPTIFAGLGTAENLEGYGIPGGIDLDWWQTKDVGNGVRVTAVPAQHWSKRGMFDDRNTLWAGFVFEGSAGPVYYSGDTGWGPHFEQVRERFGAVRLALLPIGAYLPRWFMKDNHLSPDDAVKATRVLDAEAMVPVHYGTFPLGDDGMDQARDALEILVSVAPDGERFWLLDFGHGRDLGGQPQAM